MKISDVEKRINASYNTIKRFIEKKEVYNEKIDNVLHATDLGLVELEKEYVMNMIKSSSDKLNAVDYQTMYYILSMKGLLTLKDFINFYKQTYDTFFRYPSNYIKIFLKNKVFFSIF